MKKFTLATLLVVGSLNFAQAAQTQNEEVVAQLPDNLVTAEELDAELQSLFGQAPAEFEEEQFDSNEAMDLDSLSIDENTTDSEIKNRRRPRHGGGHGPGYGPRPRPGHGPGYGHHPGYPRPRPGYPGYGPGYPRPGYPRPGYPHHPGYPSYRAVTCYASSPFGDIYRGTAYSSYTAQNIALRTCSNYTGYRCVPRGCNY